MGCSFKSTEVKFQSVESKTSMGQPVYNSIKLISDDSKDIWMMNQSHFGPNPAKENIDRIAIIVDKLKSPKVAEYFQLPAGELIWSDDLKLKKIEYKVSCFSCHANGPRALRPDYENFQIGQLDRLKIKYWNYKIAGYGRIVESANQSIEDQVLKVPFRNRTNLDNQKLNLKTCTKCHNENDSRARGYLTRQNLVTINFLIDKKIMPPEEQGLSKDEKNKLSRFIKGFESSAPKSFGATTFFRRILYRAMLPKFLQF